MSSVIRKKEFNERRENLLQKICSVNAVANEDGKGKENFKFGILMTAEDLLDQKASSTFRGYSYAVLNLSSKVRDSFNAYRDLM